MNKNAARKWVEALESGEFKQGTGYLTQFTDYQDTYCCLGVLCQVAMQNGVIVNVHKNATGYAAPAIEYDGCVLHLPKSVQEWAETDDDVILDGGSAISLNDGENKSFVEIAHAIRKTYLDE